MSAGFFLVVALGVAGCEGDGPGVAPGDSIPGSGDGSGPSGSPSSAGSVNPGSSIAEVPQPHGCAAGFDGFAVFQAVKIPLVVAGAVVQTRNAPIIQGRQAFFRAYLSYPLDTPAGNVAAQLTLTSSAGVETFSATRSVFQTSLEGDFETTLNFEVPGEHIRADTVATLDVNFGASCEGGGKWTYPPGGQLPLAAVDTGALRIRLVPIQYEADGSGRLPDLSDEQIDSFRKWLLAQYPTASVEIDVREPVRTTMALTGTTGWEAYLGALRSLRDQDSATNDLHYYGLVSPAETFSDYCDGACTAGLSYLADRPTGTLQVGAGIGFSGQRAGETLVHELGHQHGRGHTPCGGGDGIDPGFPYQDGGIGVWGLDIRTMRLQTPKSRKDLMGYCSPQWISDYTYAQLANRRLALKVAKKIVQSDPRTAGGYQSAVVTADGRLRLGARVPPGDLPAGRPETAQVLDSSGRIVKDLTIFRASFGHGGGFALDMPAAENDWRALRFADGKEVSLRSAAPILPFEPTTLGRTPLRR